MRRQFEYKCPTRRECQPDSSTREDRLPRALLSAHFVRHRQKPRSPERPDPPIAPFDIVHRCTYFRTFVPNLRTHALYRMSGIMCLFCIHVRIDASLSGEWIYRNVRHPLFSFISIFQRFRS